MKSHNFYPLGRKRKYIFPMWDKRIQDKGKARQSSQKSQSQSQRILEFLHIPNPNKNKNPNHQLLPPPPPTWTTINPSPIPNQPINNHNIDQTHHRSKPISTNQKNPAIAPKTPSHHQANPPQHWPTTTKKNPQKNHH